MVDYNPSFTFQHSSPLDTLAHRTFSRRAEGAKLLAPHAASILDHPGQNLLSSYVPNVTTPPRQQSQQRQMSPHSPLLHTQFRTSAVSSAVSYDPRNSFLDTSMSSVHGGNESQEVEYSYKDEDASVYSRPSMSSQDQHSPDPNLAPESWEDAYGGTADPDPPISQNSNNILAFQAGSPSLPTVVISTADSDTPVPIMQPTRGCKVPIAAPTKFNFSRPGRPPTLPPEDSKRRVLERNAGRHPLHQRTPPLTPLPPNPTVAHSSEAGISGSSTAWMQSRQPPISYPRDSSPNTGHNHYTPSSSSIPNRSTPSSQHYAYHPDPISYNEHYNRASSQGMNRHTHQLPSSPSTASPLPSQASHSSGVIPFSHAEGRPSRSTDPYSQPTDERYHGIADSRGSLSPDPSASLGLEKNEQNQGRVRRYESSYESGLGPGGVGRVMNTNKGKQTEDRPAVPQEVLYSSHHAPLHSLDPTLRHEPQKTDSKNSYGASTRSKSPAANGTPLPDYPNYSLASSEVTSRPSTSTATSTTPRTIIELPRGPPPRTVSPAASVYSQYSFYQLDSKSPSPTGSVSRFSPDSAGFHGPPDQTRPPFLSPTYTPPTRSPASASRSPSPASTISPTIPPRTPQEYLQLGIQHHEANRLKDSAVCFEKSAKEGGGCGVGMVMWGLTLRHGWGCEKNEKLGFKWLQKAAESAVMDLESSRRGLDVNAVQVRATLFQH